MSITTRFHLNDPDKIEATMSISMRLGDWKKVGAAISGMKEYPSWDLSHAIRKMIDTAEQSFYGRTDGKDAS